MPPSALTAAVHWLAVNQLIPIATLPVLFLDVFSLSAILTVYWLVLHNAGFQLPGIHPTSGKVVRAIDCAVAARERFAWRFVVLQTAYTDVAPRSVMSPLARRVLAYE